MFDALPGLYIRYAVILTWDDSKRQANIAKHGLDFGALTPEFFEISIIRRAKFGRYRAIGRGDDGLVVAVVFRPLGSEALSIVSMRPASKKERLDAEKNA